MNSRTAAVLRKELRDYARNRLVIWTMALLPLIFIALPTIQLFTSPALAASPR
jgi:ABC-2 type transport system permease protein